MEGSLSEELLKYAKEQAAVKIAGEVVLSEDHNLSLRTWRTLLGISQTEVARHMGIASSVISDYENGKRKYPGVRFLKKYIQSLIEIDARNGGKHIFELVKLENNPPGSIIAMREFNTPVRISTLLEATRSEILAGNERAEDQIFGYTVLDSVKTIIYFTGMEMMRLFGRTTNRALIFTNVTHGRSPMVAVRLYPFKPNAVVIHGPKELDPVAIEIAKMEGIPTALCKLPSVNDLVGALKDVELLESVREGHRPSRTIESH